MAVAIGSAAAVVGLVTLAGANFSWVMATASPRDGTMPGELDTACCRLLTVAGGIELSTNSATLMPVTAPGATVVEVTVLSAP